jgi:hypothetical protein
MEIFLRDRFFVKLTDYGEKVYLDYYIKCGITPPRLTGEHIKFKLSDLMLIFGSHLQENSPPVFENNKLKMYL